MNKYLFYTPNIRIFVVLKQIIMARIKTYPQLVVFHEKYGDNFYLVESAEAESKMFLEVLTDRFNTGWYNWMKDSKPYGKKPEYTREDVEKMPDSMSEVKKSFLLEIAKWERAEKEAELTRSNFLKIKTAVEEKNGKVAESAIRKYSEGEYEGFEYETFTHIK